MVEHDPLQNQTHASPKSKNFLFSKFLMDNKRNYRAMRESNETLIFVKKEGLAFCILIFHS